MSRFRLISAILRGAWQIEPFSALSYYPAVQQLLDGGPSHGDVPDWKLSDTRQAKEPEFKWEGAVYGTDGYALSYVPRQVADVAIVPLNGPIMKEDFCGTAGTKTVGQWIRQADADPAVRGIVLEIDSPGGTVDGTASLAEIVAHCSKPIVAFVDGLMASAAYRIGCEADLIMAGSPEDWIGSIGTMMRWTSYKAYYEKIGINQIEVYADSSPDKNLEFREAVNGNFTPLKENLLNPSNALFRQAVLEARPNATLKAVSGGIFLAQGAIEHGLIDSVGSLDEAIQTARSITKTVKTKNTMNKTFAAFWAKVTGKTIDGDGASDNSEAAVAQPAADQMAADIEAHVDEQTATITRLTGEVATANTALATATATLTERDATIATNAARITELEAQIDTERATGGAAQPVANATDPIAADQKGAPVNEGTASYQELYAELAALKAKQENASESAKK